VSKASRIILIVVGNLALVGLLVAGFFWFEKREVVPGAGDSALSDDSAGADESDDDDEPAKVKTIGQWSPLPAPKPSDPDVDLDHWHGQVFFVNFWASWCTACSEERPQLDQLAAEFPKSMVGIATMDSVAQVGESEAEHPHKYPIGVDEDGTISQTLGIEVLPQSLVVDGRGRILRRFMGVLTDVQVEAIRTLLRGKQ
jgi:cytochrome c-type biogenesis protein